MFKMTCFFIPSWQNEMNLAEDASPLAKCDTDWSLQLNKTREATMILASLHTYMSVTMVRAHTIILTMANVQREGCLIFQI